MSACGQVIADIIASEDPFSYAQYHIVYCEFPVSPASILIFVLTFWVIKHFIDFEQRSYSASQNDSIPCFHHISFLSMLVWKLNLLWYLCLMAVQRGGLVWCCAFSLVTAGCSLILHSSIFTSGPELFPLTTGSLVWVSKHSNITADSECYLSCILSFCQLVIRFRSLCGTCVQINQLGR